MQYMYDPFIKTDPRDGILPFYYSSNHESFLIFSIRLKGIFRTLLIIFRLILFLRLYFLMNLNPTMKKVFLLHEY